MALVNGDDWMATTPASSESTGEFGPFGESSVTAGVYDSYPITYENDLYGPPKEIVDEVARISEIAKVAVPIVIILLLVLGLVANSLVVYVTIVTNRTTKHPIHSIFVLNLAAADVLFLIISAPYRIAITTTDGWRFGSFLCPVIPFLSTTTVASSIYTICALAWMRFMALVMPFRFRRSCISTRRAGYFVVLAIWIAGVILSIPYLAYFRLRYDAIGVSCEWNGSQHSHKIYAVVKLVATYIFPLILVTVFYAVIGREVLCYMMSQSSRVNRAATEEHKECVKSTVVVLSLILAFLICWLPHLLETVFSITGVLGHKLNDAIPRFLFEIFGKCMSYAHAFVNPFIYTFASPAFRRSLRASLSEKIRNCGRANSVCKRATIVRRKQRDRRKMRLAFDANSDKNTKTNGASNQVTPKTEHVHMLTVLDCHSTTHVTDITRTASPELSNNRRFVEVSLNVVEDEATHNMLPSTENCNENTPETTQKQCAENGHSGMPKENGQKCNLRDI